jgi:ABC-type multidrug transport system fused ATPase/permease subunit
MKPYLKNLVTLSLKRKHFLTPLIILVVIDAILRLSQPYIYKLLVDTLTEGLVGGGFTEEATSFLVMLVAIWFFVSIFNNLAHAQSTYLGWEVGNRNAREVHNSGYKRLLNLDYHEHTKKHSSRFSRLVDDAETATWDMTNWLLNRIFPSILGFFGMLIIAFSVSWKMTLLSLTVIPFGLGLVIFMIKKYENEQHKINKLWNKMYEHMSDQLSNIVTYKLNQNEKLFLEVQKGYSDRASLAQRAMNKKWRLTSMLNPDIIARFMVMGFGIFLVQNGDITLGTLFMFMGLLNEILSPLHLLSDILPQFSRKARHIDRYLELMKKKDKILDPEEGFELEKIKGKIEFKEIYFHYPEQNGKGFGLENVSFVINPGEEVAVVGHSGAGKTTVATLLTRLTDITSGQILVDDIDIRSFKQENYRKHIGVVLQENAMYNETVAQNIMYGKPEATKEEIISAAKKAQAHDFIMKLPQQYDTLIGERGVRLSGGEKQRIAIARAILKEPAIVILDEPTSALDSITEAKVQKGLMELMQGRTSIVIAHRLSTVRNADKIIIFKEGKVVDIGSHLELLRKNSEYREMVEL